jgi:hypothetical protein
MARLVLVIWLIFVAVLSILPFHFKSRLHTMGTYHNIGHYAVYLMTGILIWVAAERGSNRVIGFLLGVGLSFGQEWLENHVYHAGFEWRDVGTDLAGLISSFGLMLVVLALTDDSARRPI